MWKQVGANVAYNLGIVLSVMAAYWSFNNNKSYIQIIFFALIAALFVYLKINLVKDVRKRMRDEELKRQSENLSGRTKGK